MGMFRNLLVQCSPRVGTLLILAGAFSVAHAAIFAEKDECVIYDFKIVQVTKDLETDTRHYMDAVTVNVLEPCKGINLYDNQSVTIPAGKRTLQKLSSLAEAKRQAAVMRDYYTAKGEGRRLASHSRDPVVLTRLLEEKRE